MDRADERDLQILNDHDCSVEEVEGLDLSYEGRPWAGLSRLGPGGLRRI
jgi:hypothetical protein